MTNATPKKPVSIQLIGPAFPIWDELAVHLRNGYVIQPDLGIELGHNGNAIVNLILGNPSTAAIERANGSNELAQQQEQAAFDRAVKEEAKRLAEQAARDALEQRIAAIKADQAKAIRELERATAAEIAKLQ
ncbi:hypothetical protein [Massilia luteola]|uniref:hypothetical protein n=1 Tax=Massilia luteola TaxID=3081751 RepID=UPI002ACBF9FD|nr:hypothetical protein [Massilia sp. Gc5]